MDAEAVCVTARRRITKPNKHNWLILNPTLFQFVLRFTKVLYKTTLSALHSEECAQEPLFVMYTNNVLRTRTQKQMCVFN